MIRKLLCFLGWHTWVWIQRNGEPSGSDPPDWAKCRYCGSPFKPVDNPVTRCGDALKPAVECGDGEEVEETARELLEREGNLNILNHLGLPVDTVCRWASDFNSWRWPNDFPIPMPDGWDALPDKEKFKNIAFQICCAGSRDLAPDIYSSHYHHTVVMGRTDEQWMSYWEHRGDRVWYVENFINEHPEYDEETKRSLRDTLKQP